MVLNNGFPVQGPVAAMICAVAGGLPGGPQQVLTRPYRLWHRRNVPNNGVTRLVFFNEAVARYVTNLQQQSALPANWALIALGVRIGYLHGFDRLGSRANVSATVNQTSLGFSGASATDTILDELWRIHETSRELIEQGEVTLNIGNREIFNIFGLDSFPEGGSYQIGGNSSGAGAGATTTTHQQFATTIGCNGVPHLSNYFPFHSPFPIPAGQTIQMAIDWNTAVDFQAAGTGPLVGATAGNPAGVICVELDGIMISPASA